MWQFTSPRTIVFGEDALEHLEDLEGEKALIIAGRTVRKLGVIDRVTELLEEAGIDVNAFDQIEPEPSMDTIRRAAETARNLEPDWIIGLG